MRFLGDILRDRRGATVIEYAMVAAFIAMVVAGTMGQIGGKTLSKFSNVANTF